MTAVVVTMFLVAVLASAMYALGARSLPHHRQQLLKEERSRIYLKTINTIERDARTLTADHPEIAALILDEINAMRERINNKEIKLR